MSDNNKSLSVFHHSGFTPVLVLTVLIFLTSIIVNVVKNDSICAEVACSRRSYTNIKACM